MCHTSAHKPVTLTSGLPLHPHPEPTLYPPPCAVLPYYYYFSTLCYTQATTFWKINRPQPHITAMDSTPLEPHPTLTTKIDRTVDLSTPKLKARSPPPLENVTLAQKLVIATALPLTAQFKGTQTITTKFPTKFRMPKSKERSKSKFKSNAKSFTHSARPSSARPILISQTHRRRAATAQGVGSLLLLQVRIDPKN